jgi:hypothetical protein
VEHLSTYVIPFVITGDMNVRFDQPNEPMTERYKFSLQLMPLNVSTYQRMIKVVRWMLLSHIKTVNHLLVR